MTNPWRQNIDFSPLGRGLAGLGKGIGIAKEKQAQQEQADAQRKVYGQFFDAVDSGDIELQKTIRRNNPMMVEQFKQIESTGNQALDTIQDQMAVDTHANNMTGAQLSEKYGQQLQSLNQGDLAAQLPTMSQQQLKDMSALSWFSSDSFDRMTKMKEGDDGSNIGAVSPKDFTVESMAEYEKTGDISALERYRPKTVKIGNVEHSYNNETMKYEPIVDMRSEDFTAQERAAAENQADRQARLDFGKEKSKFETNRPKYLSSISGAEQKQTVIRNTADKIKDLMGGWSNKYGASLSSLPGSEARTLKGLIDTMKANSAFSTLTDLKASGGTLGAISEAELNLLERAWGALDQGGDMVEFERVLDQLVDQNSGSLQRARNAFGMNKDRYSGSYDDAQRKIEKSNTVRWEDM